MSKASDTNRDDAPLGKKIEDLYALIDGIEIAMFTTRRPDGHLVSRPMATQTQAEGTDLWFVTDIESNKLDELGFDAQVNLAYYRDRTRCVTRLKSLLGTPWLRHGWGGRQPLPRTNGSDLRFPPSRLPALAPECSLKAESTRPVAWRSHAVPSSDFNRVATGLGWTMRERDRRAA